MSASSMMARGRAVAESLMPDWGTVTRPGGPATFNATTGVLAPSAGTVVHEGRCRVRKMGAGGRSEVIFGEQQVTLAQFEAIFPHDVTDIAKGDVVTVSESDDADVIGRAFRVLRTDSSTFTIYKAFPLEVVE